MQPKKTYPSCALADDIDNGLKLECGLESNSTERGRFARETRSPFFTEPPTISSVNSGAG